MLDLTAASNILKTIYRDDLMDELVYTKRPLLAMLPKWEQFGAKDMKFPLLIGNPQSISASFANAQSIAIAAGASSQWGLFDVTRATRHGVAQISGDAIRATRNDQAAFVKAVKVETDGILNGMANQVAAQLVGAGWGDIGQIGSINSATITLLNVQDIVKFEVGQVHQFCDTQSSSVLRNSGGTLQVIAVDRQLGTVTYNAAVSTLGAVAANDYIFLQGDRQNSATPTRQVLVGLEAWLPSSAPVNGGGDSFFGQDRSTDATRLAGCRLNASGSSGASLEEVLLDADAIVFREGGALSHFFVAPKVYADLAKSMGSRVRYQDVKAGRIGFSSILVAGQAGDINVMADRTIPTNRVYGLELDKWELATDQKVVRLNDEDGLGLIVRIYNADAYESRIVSCGQLVCHAPSHNINVQI